MKPLINLIADLFRAIVRVRFLVAIFLIGGIVGAAGAIYATRGFISWAQNFSTIVAPGEKVATSILFGLITQEWDKSANIPAERQVAASQEFVFDIGKQIIDRHEFLFIDDYYDQYEEYGIALPKWIRKDSSKWQFAIDGSFQTLSVYDLPYFQFSQNIWPIKGLQRPIVVHSNEPKRVRFLEHTRFDGKSISYTPFEHPLFCLEMARRNVSEIQESCDYVVEFASWAEENFNTDLTENLSMLRDNFIEPVFKVIFDEKFTGSIDLEKPAGVINLEKEIVSGLVIDKWSVSDLREDILYLLFPLEDLLALAIQKAVARKGISFTGIRSIKVESDLRVGNTTVGFASYVGEHNIKNFQLNGKTAAAHTVHQIGYIIAGRNQVLYIDVFAADPADLRQLAKMLGEIRINESIFQ